MTNKITREMDIEDVAQMVPKAIGSLTRRGIICIQCGTPLWKTVEQAIMDAGKDDVDSIIAEVNREINE